MTTMKLLKSSVCLLCLLIGSGSAFGDQPIDVAVSGAIEGDVVTYTYTVANTSNASISGLTVGLMRHPTTAELLHGLIEQPLGTTSQLVDSSDRAESYIVPSSSSRQPDYWTLQLVASEDEDVPRPHAFALQWDSAAANAYIGSGQTAEFAIKVKLLDHVARKRISELVDGRPYTADPCYRGDLTYVDTLVNVEMSDGSVAVVQARRGTTAGPSLGATLSPAQLSPPTDQLIPVTVSLTSPSGENQVCLSKITANQTLIAGVDFANAAIGTRDTSFDLKATLGLDRVLLGQIGRTYSVTYVSTDPIGNRTAVVRQIKVVPTP